LPSIGRRSALAPILRAEFTSSPLAMPDSMLFNILGKLTAADTRQNQPVTRRACRVGV